MENFFTTEYLIAYVCFVILLVMYLVADSKVRKLQLKCSKLSNLAAEVRNVPVEEIEERSKSDFEKGSSLALGELKILQSRASDVIYEIQKKKRS